MIEIESSSKLLIILDKPRKSDANRWRTYRLGIHLAVNIQRPVEHVGSVRDRCSRGLQQCVCHGTFCRINRCDGWRSRGACRDHLPRDRRRQHKRRGGASQRPVRCQGGQGPAGNCHFIVGRRHGSHDGATCAQIPRCWAHQPIYESVHKRPTQAPSPRRVNLPNRIRPKISRACLVLPHPPINGLEPHRARA